MKKVISKKVLVLLSLLLFLPLFSGCFLTPSVNQAPTITSTPITTATIDEPYTYNVNATDPDGDTLTYSLTTHPTGMTINSATGVINWIPSVEGDYDIIVEVSDGEKSTTQSFTITVSEEPIIPPSSPPIINPPVNHAPTITFIPDALATVDVLYTYDVNATDPDGDTLTYSLTANPTGMTIDPATGLINWTPTFVQIGDHNVTVEVSDGSLNDAQPFTITVHDVLDYIVVLPETMTLFEEGETDSIDTITAHYNNGATAVIDLDACTYDSDTVGVATVAVGVVTTVDPGTATITVTYIEGGITETDTVAVTVNPILLDSITVLPETMTLFVGETGTISSIMASYNHGSDQSKALAACTYGSSAAGVATVAVGVVTGVSAGSATITVSYLEGGITMTDTVAVTVNPILLTSITVSPATMTLFVGETGTISSIMASYNHGSDQSKALAACTYGSSAAGVATVAVGVVTGVSAGSATITVSYLEGGITMTDTVAVTVNAIELTSITVSPATMTLFVGETGTISSIMASYNYGDDVSIDLGDAACIYTFIVGVVNMPGPGEITGVAAGSVTITVEYTEGAITKSDTVEVEVVADLIISPSTQTVTAGDTFTIDIIVENVTELQGVTVELGFNDSIIGYKSLADGGFLPDPIALKLSESNDSVTLTIAGTTIPNYSSGTGTVLTVTFDALTAGTSDILFNSTELRHDTFTLISHKVKSESSVTVN